MYGSQAMSKDLNLPFPASPFRLGRGESDLELSHEHHGQHQMSSSLLRYRSAPSAVLGDVCEELFPHRSSSPDAAAESMFARFMAPDHMGLGGKGPPPVAPPQSSSSFTSSTLQMPFHSPHLPNLTSAAASASLEDGPFGVMSSAGIGQDSKKTGVNGVAHLIRHGSSPAGLFSNLNVEDGFPTSRGMGGFRLNGGSSNAEPGSTPSRLKGQISFSSRQGSGLSLISEIGSDNMGGSSSDDGIGDDPGGTRYYIPGYPVASWEDSALLSEGFLSGMKRGRDPSEAQNGEMMRSHASALTHQFSLPKTSSEMAAMERFLQFQDAVPCKIRAKRGCATHPRSIAERVRRTKISERMRKLQELVPNMDKQTNTADMLDLAVEYIKDLQRQTKTISESRANCSCPAKQMS